MEETDWKRRGIAAEKTVEVLKTKVRSMYQGGSKTAVQRQLEKSRARDEKNRQRRAMMELRSAELERYSATLESEVAERTREIQVILDNVTFGFLLIDRDLKVRSGFTKSCEVLVGAAVSEGQSLGDVLGCEGKDAITLQMSLEQVVDDFLPEEVSLAQLPVRFTPNDSILHLDARCVRDDDGEIVSLLCTLSDVRALEAAEQASQIAEVLVGILARKDAFVNFVQETKVHVESAKDACQAGDTTFVARAVHTVKGNAASYALSKVVAVVHQAEEDGDISIADLDLIESTLVEFLDEHAKVLGVNYRDTIEETFTLSQGQMRELETLLSRVNAPDVERWLTQLRLKSVGVIMGPVEAYVRRLGERLEKPVAFSFVGEEIRVDSQPMAPVLGNLSHVLRNAVDHGIEEPGERGEKPEIGVLELSVVERDSGWTVVIRDDGRGIDVDRLSEKALERNCVTRAELDAMSRDEKLRLVFLDGLSSCDVATDLSGRGVGMSAVLGAVEQAGGRVDIESHSGEGTMFTIFVPKTLASQAAA